VDRNLKIVFGALKMRLRLTTCAAHFHAHTHINWFRVNLTIDVLSNVKKWFLAVMS